jgi:hypothetical protein
MHLNFDPGLEPKYRYGPRYTHLPLARSVEDSDELAFGLLDPSLVIRADVISSPGSCQGGQML